MPNETAHPDLQTSGQGSVMGLEVREARPEDATEIAQLISVLGYELDSAQVSDRLAEYTGGVCKVFVALHQDRVAGFLSFHSIPMFHAPSRLGRITALAIDSRHHRQGIGRALVKAAETFASRIGCTRIEVTSGDHREHDAHLFYLSLDYRVDCRRFLKILPIPDAPSLS